MVLRAVKQERARCISSDVTNIIVEEACLKHQSSWKEKRRDDTSPYVQVHTHSLQVRASQQHVPLGRHFTDQSITLGRYDLGTPVRNEETCLWPQGRKSGLLSSWMDKSLMWRLVLSIVGWWAAPKLLPVRCTHTLPPGFSN